MARPPLRRPWAAFALAEGEGLCSPALELTAWSSWARRLPALLESEAAEPLRHVFIPTSGRQTFRMAGPEGRPVVVKRYAPWAATGHAAGQPTDGVQPARAFGRQIELHAAGQPVPEPLLFLAGRQEPPNQVCYAVSRLLEDCTILTDFAFEHLHRRPSQSRQLLGWMADVVHAIAGLHRAGFVHGDLHQHNILIRHEPAAAHLQVFWTDFDACARVAGPWPNEDQLRDVALLGASLYRLVSDALLRRALGCYLALGGMPAARRRQAHRVIREAFRCFLEESRRGFALVEQHCLAEAERSLARCDLLP